jgi:hypothetical protein
VFPLATIELTEPEKIKLHAAQMKGYRRIFQVPPTNIDREMTNMRVIEKLEKDHDMKFELFTDSMCTSSGQRKRTHYDKYFLSREHCIREWMLSRDQVTQESSGWQRHNKCISPHL